MALLLAGCAGTGGVQSALLQGLVTSSSSSSGSAEIGYFASPTLSAGGADFAVATADAAPATYRANHSGSIVDVPFGGNIDVVRARRGIYQGGAYLACRQNPCPGRPAEGETLAAIVLWDSGLGSPVQVRGASVSGTTSGRHTCNAVSVGRLGLGPGLGVSTAHGELTMTFDFAGARLTEFKDVLGDFSGSALAKQTFDATNGTFVISPNPGTSFSRTVRGAFHGSQAKAFSGIHYPSGSAGGDCAAFMGQR